MKQTTAPVTTPSPKQKATQSPSKSTSKTDDPTAAFVGATLDMSWRLAVVVLVPIIGGNALDQKLGFSPILLISGFVLAFAGVIVVMRQTLHTINEATKDGAHS